MCQLNSSLQKKINLKQYKKLVPGEGLVQQDHDNGKDVTMNNVLNNSNVLNSNRSKFYDVYIDVVTK